MSTCEKDHTGDLPAGFRRLPESQASAWRHLCAGCAYELGRRHNQEAEERLREQVRDLTRVVKELSKGRTAP